jgi:uncharacterized protein YneF (UPF0154 family)
MKNNLITAGFVIAGLFVVSKVMPSLLESDPTSTFWNRK